jgi:hypothetical protein
MANGKTNIFVASAWMVGLTLIFFFLPLINGLVGGFVGGYMAGDWKRALGAALIPAVLVSLVLWALFALFNAPVLGLFAGGTGFLVVVFADIGMFIGAWIGGLFAASGSRERHVTT